MMCGPSIRLADRSSVVSLGLRLCALVAESRFASTADLDFTCFNSMAGRNSPPTIVKFKNRADLAH